LELTKSGRTTNEEANLNKDCYYSDLYFSTDQFISFSEQIRLVKHLNRKNILEIGIGNGIVADFLKKAGLTVTTLDINANLSPDIVGSVTDLLDIFKESNFDIVLCAEVLEHMPFEYFEQAISNISKTTNEYAILTLPRCQKVIVDFQFNLKIPKFSYIEKGIFFSIPSSKISKEHHWELDSSKKTKYKEIVRILDKYFSITTSGRFRFRAYHQYFILKKIL
jgi:uncharacterized UPF0146 family protein